MARDGLPLSFEHTVRAVTSQIDLNSLAEDFGGRVNHDNAGPAVAAAFGPYGNYLFTVLEANRQVVVTDRFLGTELLRIPVEFAPQAALVSPDGTTLYVHNFLSRSISVVDVSPIILEGRFEYETLATYQTVGDEQLDPTILLGKQLFHDAADPRLAQDGYLSCAACHADGGHDGRVWDFTGMGEGLRNTISLNGKGGMGHGALHWTGNFDEVQDFENQMRELNLGTGLMDDADFHFGSRGDVLGDPKAGVAPDLDALALYVASLDTTATSPMRLPDGELTEAGAEGKALFEAASCAACHGGENFSRSQVADNELYDVGTLKPTSGQRLNDTLAGIDVPTLRDLWATGPYLHDGSAATVADAVAAHDFVSLTADELDLLAVYLLQVDQVEPAPLDPVVAAPNRYFIPFSAYLSQSGR